MPRHKRPVYGEPEVSGLVRTLLAPSALAWYSLESGAQGHWDPARERFIERPGGTRTTPGFPDLVGLMTDPEPYTLMVEAKGRGTPIKEAQWAFAARAALVGQPCLIVRSPGALLNGLAFLDLLPRRLRRMPSVFWDQWDMAEWPENVNYLPAMARRFWNLRIGREPGAGVSEPILPGPAVAAGSRRREPPYPIGAEWRER